MSSKTIKRLRSELERTTTLLSYLCKCIESGKPPEDQMLNDVFKWWNEKKVLNPTKSHTTNPEF